MFRWSALLLVPLAAGALLGRPLADRFGTGVAEQLSIVARLLPRPATLPPEPEPLDEHVTEAAPARALQTKPPAATQRANPAKSAKPGGPLPGIRVSKAVVLSLADRGVRPSGTPVPAQGKRPAGIALSGVSGLGLGVLDGDVLTAVEGRPARAPGQVIDAVIRARGRRADTISGVLYRGQERYILVVEQPY